MDHLDRTVRWTSLTDQLNRKLDGPAERTVGWTCWTEQFFFFETLVRLNIRRFSFVHCHSFWLLVLEGFLDDLLRKKTKLQNWRLPKLEFDTNQVLFLFLFLVQPRGNKSGLWLSDENWDYWTDFLLKIQTPPNFQLNLKFCNFIDQKFSDK